MAHLFSSLFVVLDRAAYNGCQIAYSALLRRGQQGPS
jgi:hypothetical protein